VLKHPCRLAGAANRPKRATSTRRGAYLPDARCDHAIGEQAGAINRVDRRLSREEQQAHELVATWLRELGFTSGADAIGNTMADLVRAPAPGWSSDRMSTLRRWRRLRWNRGMVAAVEVARYFASRQPGLQHPLRVACSRARRMRGLVRTTGQPRGRWSSCSERPGRTDRRFRRDCIGSLENLGLDPNAVGSAQWKPDECAAFFELHVEQGNELEETGRQRGAR